MRVQKSYTGVLTLLGAALMCALFGVLVGCESAVLSTPKPSEDAATTQAASAQKGDHPKPLADLTQSERSQESAADKNLLVGSIESFLELPHIPDFDPVQNPSTLSPDTFSSQTYQGSAFVFKSLDDEERARCEQGYYYQKLTDSDEKRAYEAVYQALMKMSPEVTVKVSNQSFNPHDLIYFVTFDHPEIFWFDMYQATQSNWSDELQQGCAVAHLTYGDWSPEKLVSTRTQMVEGLKILMNRLQSTNDQEALVRSIFQVTSQALSYAGDAHNQNMISALSKGTGICAGYAQVFQSLCLLNQVEAFYHVCEMKTASPDEAHVIVGVVFKDGRRYMCDPTWGHFGAHKNADGIDFSYCLFGDRFYTEHYAPGDTYQTSYYHMSTGSLSD